MEKKVFKSNKEGNLSKIRQERGYESAHLRIGILNPVLNISGMTEISMLELKLIYDWFRNPFELKNWLAWRGFQLGLMFDRDVEFGRD